VPNKRAESTDRTRCVTKAPVSKRPARRDLDSGEGQTSSAPSRTYVARSHALGNFALWNN